MRDGPQAFSPWSPRQRFLSAVCLSSCLIFFGALDPQRLSYERHMVVHLIVFCAIAPLLSSLLTLRVSMTALTLGCFLLGALLIPAYHVTTLGSLVMESGQAYGIELIVFLLIGIYAWLPIYARGERLSPLAQLSYVAMTATSLLLTGLVLVTTTTSPISQMTMAGKDVDLAVIHRGGEVMVAVTIGIFAVHLVILGVRVAKARHSPAFGGA